MVLEIWKAISAGCNEYYFIIDTITFAVYAQTLDSCMDNSDDCHKSIAGLSVRDSDNKSATIIGMLYILFFITKKEAEEELKNIKKDKSDGCWIV